MVVGESVTALRLEVVVVSARFRLLVVVDVSVGLVSLEEVDGAEMSAGLGVVRGVMEEESMQLVDVGLVVEMVRGGAEEAGQEGVVTGVSGMTVSVELVGADAAAEVTEVDSSLVSVTEFVIGDVFDVLVVGKEEVAAGVASTERMAFGSGSVSVGRSVNFVDGCVSSEEAVMEGRVIVVVLGVTERPGVMDPEEVEVTETVVMGSACVVVLVIAIGFSGVSALASGTEGLLSGSVTAVGVVAAGLTESVHISESEGSLVLEGEIVALFESGVELEIVGTVGAVAAVGAAGAAGADGVVAGLSLVGVFVSPSCIWASSFSGVLRPDVAGGGPGLRTGFGSKAGFPADSCADTLVRIWCLVSKETNRCVDYFT